MAKAGLSGFQTPGFAKKGPGNPAKKFLANIDATAEVAFTVNVKNRKSISPIMLGNSLRDCLLKRRASMLALQFPECRLGQMRDV